MCAQASYKAPSLHNLEARVQDYAPSESVNCDKKKCKLATVLSKFLVQ